MGEAAEVGVWEAAEVEAVCARTPGRGVRTPGRGVRIPGREVLERLGTC